jgi:tetratricopeptide (TPR) repeat protein
VWKLRDGRVAQILLRGSPPAESTALVGARPWLRWTGWVGASLVLASAVAAMAERGAFESAAGAASPERMERSAARLAWLGRSSPMHDVALAQAHLLRGDHARAREALDRADALFPTAASHRARGEILSREQRWREALEAYDAALALDPRNARAWRESAHVLEALGDEKGAMQRRRRAGRIGRVEQAPY